MKTRTEVQVSESICDVSPSIDSGHLERLRDVFDVRNFKQEHGLRADGSDAFMFTWQAVWVLWMRKLDLKGGHQWAKHLLGLG